MNGQSINALGFLMSQMRPEWDPPGCVAALRKMPDLPLAEVVIAVARYAADEQNTTPANLSNLSNRTWDSDGYPPCRVHGRRAGRRTSGECGSCYADRTAVTEPQPLTRQGRAPTPDQRQQILTAIGLGGRS